MAINRAYLPQSSFGDWLQRGLRPSFVEGLGLPVRESVHNMLSNRIKQPLGLFTTPTSARDDMPQPIPLPKAETSEINVRDIDRHPRDDSPPITAQVTFNVFAKTVPGENVYVTGSIQELGSWSSNDARILHCTQSYPMWT
ncbi:hypothetical protein FRB90_008223, partial [Tulasnella sp. 427]